MDAKIINSFIQSADAILTGSMGIELKQGKPTVNNPISMGDQVCVVIGFIGDIQGTMALGFKIETALNIAKHMCGGMEFSNLEEISISALSELGNMIGGHSSIKLDKEGYNTDIMPPRFIMVDNPIELLSEQQLTLTFDSSLNDFRIYIKIKSKT